MTFVQLAAANAHLPAYPAGTYNHDINPGTFPRPAAAPADFADRNDRRYSADPYAEDAMRLLNYTLSRLCRHSRSAADEADDGAAPIPGTNDGFALYYETTSFAKRLRAGGFAYSATVLAGTVVQDGDPVYVTRPLVRVCHPADGGRPRLRTARRRNDQLRRVGRRRQRQQP